MDGGSFKSRERERSVWTGCLMPSLSTSLSLWDRLATPCHGMGSADERVAVFSQSPQGHFVCTRSHRILSICLFLCLCLGPKRRIYGSLMKHDRHVACHVVLKICIHRYWQGFDQGPNPVCLWVIHDCLGRTDTPKRHPTDLLSHCEAWSWQYELKKLNEQCWYIH